jgi:NitT/TauT family transport system ATP-binding protein
MTKPDIVTHGGERPVVVNDAPAPPTQPEAKAGTGTAVECDRVGFAYDGAEDNPILRDVSFSVGRAEFVSIVWPSGCGKSTLLHVIAGLRLPTAGGVSVFGSEVTGTHGKAAYMMQKDTLLPWLRAVDNVNVAFEAQGRGDTGKAQSLLEAVGLRDAGRKYPHELSGGMRKRVQLARLLAQDAELFLMDEPFAALDVQTRLVLQEELLRLCEAHHKAVLFVTHDVAEACFLGDRVLVLDKYPATVRYRHDIDAPRPRDFHELVDSPAFTEVQKSIWEELREFHGSD